MDQNDLSKRLFRFAVDVLKMLQSRRKEFHNEIIEYQLGKSSTSSGANYEEAQAAVSKADFRNKVSIALKEMRESNYWLRILIELYPNNEEVLRLANESLELKKILGSICLKIKQNALRQISLIVFGFLFSLFLFFQFFI